MRATEYLHSIAHGIQEDELYSHLDTRSEKIRDEITLKRREIKKATKQDK